MSLSSEDIQAIVLSLKLATVVTSLLLVFGIPVAWWLSQSKSPWKTLIQSLLALPLVLPPTVLGFYLLLLMGPDGWLGKLFQMTGLPSLSFTFWGLVFASLIFSAPFVIQPLQNSFEAIGKRPLELAASAGANPLDSFLTVVFPLAKPGILTATILGFIHTIGEFGVVLMIGGSIPGETRVVSVQIYEHVEALQYPAAHALSLSMVIFSFATLLVLNSLQKKRYTLF